MDKEQFGKLLVALRNRKMLSQKQLAEMLSVSTSAVCKWEHGKNLPDMTMLNKIAEIFEVSCDDLHNPERALDTLLNPELRRDELKGEDEEKEMCTKHKRYKTTVIVATLLTILVVGVGVYQFYMYGNQSEPNITQVATRYFEDPLWGNVYEVACVVDGEVGLDLVNAYLDVIKEKIEQGEKLNTNIVKASYYDNEEDALAWEKTEYGGYVFLDVE